MRNTTDRHNVKAQSTGASDIGHDASTPPRNGSHIMSLALDGLAVFSVLIIGAAGLLTCVDIVLRNFTDSSVHGVIDITQLAMMYSVFAAIAYTSGKRGHVAVTVLTDIFPPAASRWFAMLGWLLGIVFLGIMSFAAFGQAKSVFTYGDVSQNLRLPMVLYWAPVVIGMVVAAVATIWALIEEAKEGKADLT